MRFKILFSEWGLINVSAQIEVLKVGICDCFLGRRHRKVVSGIKKLERVLRPVTNT